MKPDRLTILIFLANSKQAGGREALSLSPELNWNLKTDRRSAMIPLDNLLIGK